MLAENVLNEMLFNFGYLGRENIYDYWSEHKERFMTFLKKSDPVIFEDKGILESFESKLRWKSAAGMVLMEQVKNALKQPTDHGLPHVENVKIDFPVRRTIDLRGLSCINNQIEKIKMSHVDFSYACFDGSKLKEVVFENCVFNQVTFRECTLENCYFVQGTTLNCVNFRKAFVHIHSDGIIENVQFSPLKISHAHDCLSLKESKWRAYTHVYDEEWVQQMSVSQETIPFLNHIQILRYMDGSCHDENPLKRFKLYYYILFNQINRSKKRLIIT